MKIGILKETKNPVDNRVALTPQQIKILSEKYPEARFVVQSSKIRAFSDEEYRIAGIQVQDNVDDCDLLLGIKEADIETLHPEKHYMFFGHIAKMQPYNKPLFKTLIDRRITFSDYEYLVNNEGQRLVAFGWYAGVVGLYYTLRGWGLRNNTYELPKPHIHLTIEELTENLKNAPLGDLKIIITGAGRVSHGAQAILEAIGATRIDPDEFQSDKKTTGLTYCVAALESLVKNQSGTFDREEFKLHPEHYHSDFNKFAHSADILLSCHFWNNDQPVYLDAGSFTDKDFRIKMIGDVTCDIMGSIKSTLRASTHNNPYYDYNPVTRKEEAPFSSPSNITVMAVDTCPNALPRVTSQYFGEKLIEHVLDELLSSDAETTPVLDGATILRNGKLNTPFAYLTDYVKTL